MAEEARGRAAGAVEFAGVRAVHKEFPRAGERGAALQQASASVRNVERRRRTNPAPLALI